MLSFHTKKSTVKAFNMQFDMRLTFECGKDIIYLDISLKDEINSYLWFGVCIFKA